MRERIQTEIIDAPYPLANAYLDRLGLLQGELQTAMEAVGSNALERFEESVSRQKVLCAGLTSLAEQLQGIRGNPSAAVDGDLARRILGASQSLAGLNRQYAALLRHSSDSVRLFAAHCRSYTGQFQSAAGSGAGSGARSLSCES